MRIIYEDRDMIVCEKEAGLPVQTKNIRQADLSDLVRRHLMEDGSQEPYIGIVHRIDQPVRGMAVFAKNAKAAASLSAQVNDGRMLKVYMALIRPEDEAVMQRFSGNGELVDYLLKDNKANMSKVVPAKIAGAKKAVLRFEGGDKTAYSCFTEMDPEIDIHDVLPVKIYLQTGRHHQIRVQLSHAKAPIVGDRKYAAGRADDPKFPCLCAYMLELDHPRTGTRMKFIYGE